MDSSAPLSFPSEPADIGNLYSSYTYESPELDRVDDFKGCCESKDDDSGATQIGEDILGETEVQKGEGCLVAADAKEAARGIFISKTCVDNGNITNENNGSSCPLSLSAEPPDIKNWFSSYAYESPALDSIIDFRASEYNDITNPEENNVVHKTEEKEHFIDAVGAARNELGSTPAVLLGCIKSVEDDKSEGWLKCGHRSDEITDYVSKLEKQGINCEIISAKHFELQNETSNQNLEKSFSFDKSRKLIETNSGHAGSKSTKKLSSLAEKFNAQHPPQDTNKVSPTRRLDSTNQMNKHSVMVPNGDSEKENNENEFAGNGFVSTRKHKQNSSYQYLGPSSFSITSAADSTSSKGDAIVRRRVLSETTNIQQTTVSGTTGKWKCPQRSKPNLGPPLKQIRLEKWVHRS